ncbi:10968_t:CDS:2, partial [Dentiscutata erythropus]
LGLEISEAKIKDMIKIHLGHLTKIKKFSTIKQHEQKRTIYLYDKASTEDWEKYATVLQRSLESRQLINFEGKSIITWQQLKRVLGLSSWGKKAYWFTELERKIIINTDTREVIADFNIPNPNLLALELKVISTLEDRRKYLLSIGVIAHLKYHQTSVLSNMKVVKLIKKEVKAYPQVGSKKKISWISETIQVEVEKNLRFQSILYWKNWLEEAPPQAFIKTLNNMYIDAEWCQLQKNLPLLDLLNKRRLDLYESPNCLSCNTNAKEVHDHLAEYKGYEFL